jgi:hypothetical protein
MARNSKLLGLCKKGEIEMEEGIGAFFVGLLIGVLLVFGLALLVSPEFFTCQDMADAVQIVDPDTSLEFKGEKHCQVQVETGGRQVWISVRDWLDQGED